MISQSAVRRVRGFLFLAALGFMFSPPDAAAADLVPRGASWRWWKGRAEPSPASLEAWRATAFDDRGWSNNAAPFHYGEGLSTGTELTDMRGAYSSVYFRKTFTVSSPGEVSTIKLGVAVDDGFVAWINGREIARYNVPDGIPSRDTLAVGAVAEPVPFEFFHADNSGGLLVEGDNVLAIQAFNVSLAGSSDFHWDASLGFEFDTQPPIVEAISPLPGSTVRELDVIEVDFSERVQGVEAADLVINGVEAERVSENGPGQFVFSFPQPADGLITVSWRTAHGITDRAGIPHPFAGGSWTYTLTSSGPAPGIQISEFMADNSRTLNDEDGDSSDWIEIHNPGPNPAELEGWFLTDDPGNLAKWRFPSVSISSQGYLVVFASEKNRTSAASKLHTNFKLSPDGEYLALVDPATNVVSSFAPVYPKQLKDTSYGRVPGTVSEGFFVRPTPGSVNATGGPGFSPEVVFSRSSSTFLNPFALTLSTPSANAMIRYTVNGSAPTNTSAVYTGPIPVTNSVQVRARAYVAGLLPGPVHSEGFIQLSNDVTRVASDLPAIILHTLGQGNASATRQTATQILLFEPVNGVTSLTNKPSLSTRGAIRTRGSSTEGFPKASFALEFWDELNLDRNLSILGMPPDSDWVLYAPNAFEPSLMHNPFMHTLSKDIGRYSPRTRFVEVYLGTGLVSGAIASNRYNGIYVLEEKISIGKERVAIDKLEPEHLAPPEVQGGYLMKVDRLDPGDTGFGGAGQAMAYVDPKEREIKLPSRLPQKLYLSNYFAAFNRALNDRTNFTDPVLGYAPFIDAAAWVDFHWLNTLSANPDGFSLSTYLHKPRFGPITYGPIWDFDRTLGSTDGRDANPRLWGGGGSSHFFSFGWWTKVFRDPDFMQRYVDRYQELRRGEFSTAALHARVDMLGSQLRQAQPRERARWRVPPRGGSYQAELNRLKTWLSNRVDFLDTQFVRPPVMNKPGGSVTPGFMLTLASPTNAPIYYTLDGTDPRSPQGAVSPAAMAYTGPIRLGANARVVARVLNTAHRPRTGGDAPPLSSPWSGPASATFTVAPFTLILTEIMFHPAPASDGSSADDRQFLELKNSGGAPVNLAGLSFSAGIEFKFPANSPPLAPGARLLLVRNRAAFTAAYPSVTNIGGQFSGSLSHAGGRLTLVGPLLEPIFDFTYSDRWQPLADGFGFSLTLRNESSDGTQLGDPSVWRLSARPGGSPGIPDPIPFSIPQVLVNEVLTHTTAPQQDAVELWNPNPFSVDLSAWFLTDDFRQPRRFKFPKGTVIPANGFRVVTESEWNQGAGVKFSLKAAGDQVYLFSADAAGNLTGWFHGFDYGALPLGASAGRDVDSQGSESFLLQTRPTLGSPNAGPQIGPVLFGEIMYHPPDAGLSNNTLDEYIELRNVGSEPVLLFDPAHPANTWRVRGDVRFDFAPNTSLSAGGALVLVSFDPVEQAGYMAAFRSRYGLSLEVPVAGPWTGRLNNAGGRIELLRPDAPEVPNAPSDPPYVLVEDLAYQPAVPWPDSVSGTGRGLVRIHTQIPASDPAAWIASAPSPGTLDGDHDGLPDAWEVANGLDPDSPFGIDGPLGDPDGDGFSNLSEFLSGTHPRDISSLLAIEGVTATSSQIFLTFPTRPGRSYTVAYRDGFGGSGWSFLQTVIAPTTGGSTVVIDDRGTNRVRFYRLQLP